MFIPGLLMFIFLFLLCYAAVILGLLVKRGATKTPTKTVKKPATKIYYLNVSPSRKKSSRKPSLAFSSSKKDED